MESEGPYKSERWECQNEFVITGPGWEFVGGTYTKNEADLASRFANLAYAEGRKSMEKELVELLEFVNRIMEFFKHYTYCPRCKSDIDHTFECEVENAADSVLINFSRKCIDDFYVWKKARGIE